MDQAIALAVLALSAAALLGLLGGLVAAWHVFGRPTWASSAWITAIPAVPFAAGAAYFWFRAYQCGSCAAGGDQSRHGAFLAYVASFGLLLAAFLVFQMVGMLVGSLTRGR